MNNRSWGGDAKIQGIYRLRSQDLDRVGSSVWTKGRLLVDDLVLCVALSGDCFYTYYLIHYINYSNHKGLSMKLVPMSFGAYQMGFFFTNQNLVNFTYLWPEKK